MVLHVGKKWRQYYLERTFIDLQVLDDFLYSCKDKVMEHTVRLSQVGTSRTSCCCLSVHPNEEGGFRQSCQLGVLFMWRSFRGVIQIMVVPLQEETLYKLKHIWNFTNQLIYVVQYQRFRQPHKMVACGVDVNLVFFCCFFSKEKKCCSLIYGKTVRGEKAFIRLLILRASRTGRFSGNQALIHGFLCSHS